jgi:hypothetical protein
MVLEIKIISAVSAGIERPNCQPKGAPEVPAYKFAGMRAKPRHAGFTDRSAAIWVGGRLHARSVLTVSRQNVGTRRLERGGDIPPLKNIDCLLILLFHSP